MTSDSFFKIFVMGALLLMLGIDLAGLYHDRQQSEEIAILAAQHEDIDIDVHEIAEALDIEHHEEGDEEEGNRY